MTDEPPNDQVPEDTKALDDFLKKRAADIERDRQLRAAAEQQYAVQGAAQTAIPYSGGLLGGFTEQQMRSQCLQFAVQTNGSLSPTEIIKAAQAYLDFMTGKVASGPRLVKE